MEAGGSRVPLLPCSQGGGGEESMRVFREGIELAIHFCRAVRHNVNYGYLSSEPYLRIHNFCDRIFSCFIQSKHPPTKIALKELLHSFLDYPMSHNKCIEEVSDELLAMYQECLHGDFSSIQLLKEANARRPMWKQLNNFEIPKDPSLENIKKQNLIIFDGCQDRVARIVSKKSTLSQLYCRCKKNQRQTLATKPSALKKQKEKAVCKFGTETPSVEIIKEPNICCRLMQKQANSSEMEGSRVLQGDSMKVFKEGVSLFINKLWARHFNISQGGPNPTPMLQYLADVIFFWFTQTIKPLSFDHIVRILKNETNCLPYGTMHYHLIKEGAKKLMVLYEDCLQGNFSSVDILREESLSWASSFEETTVTVTHRHGYGSHTRWE